MRSGFVAFLIFIILIPAIVSGQTKVGTAGTSFLEGSLSLRANGMGEAGVALFDPHSMYFNPAGLGLYATQQRISITPPLWSTTLPVDFRKQLALAIVGFDARQFGLGLPLSCGLGWYRVKFESPEMVETDYYRAPTGRLFQWIEKSDNFVFALAYNGSVRIALGGTYKLIEQGAEGRFNDKAHAFDYGATLQLPLDSLFNMRLNETISAIVRPVFGVAWRNEGLDVDSGDNSYPLHSSRRWGYAIELGVKWKIPFWDWRLISITSAIDDEKTHLDDWLAHRGVEMGLVEAVSFRIGECDGRDDDSTTWVYNPGGDFDRTTWGFTISSPGLVKVLAALTSGTSTPPSRTLQFLMDRIAVEYTEARYNYKSLFPDRKYRGLTISYRHTLGH